MDPVSELMKIKKVNGGTVAFDNGNATAIEIDTLGASAARITYTFGNVDDADITALSLHESASGTFTPASGNKITSAEFTGSDLPVDADDNKIWSIYLDLRNRERYLESIVTAGNGTADCVVSITADLYMDETPYTAAERGNDGGEVILPTA